MARIAHAKPAPAARRHGHWWLVRGESVHLSCGGDELPVEWWDGNDCHQRDGGRWWTPERALALYRWGSEAEAAIRGILTTPEGRAKTILFRQEFAWWKKIREEYGSAPIPDERRQMPLPLSAAAQAWVDRQGAIADELAQLALDTHPKLAGERPAWITLRHCVTRDERWLDRAVELGVLPPPPIVGGRPILPVQRAPVDDDARMRAAEELARDMVPQP